MVVTFLPPTVDIWVWQDLTALPLIVNATAVMGFLPGKRFTIRPVFSG
jgi:hypothetical protein